MKKKASAFAVALLLLFQTLLGASAWTTHAAASVQESVYGVTYSVYNPTSPVVHSDNILTKVVLTDTNGSVIDAVYHPDSSLDIGAAVNLSYEWELPNGHGYKAGDTFTFELPTQFEIFTDIDEPLVSDQGEVGRFTVDRNGKVVMTFNDYVENHSNVSGKLEIRTEFRKELIKGSTEIIIAIPVRSGEQTVIVRLKPQGGKLIEKQGNAVGKNQINWTVKINTTLDKIKHAVVTDAMPEGLELIDGSVEVYHLQVNGDGSTLLGDKVEDGKVTVATNNGAKLELAFADETIGKAYEIRFSTKLTDGPSGKVKFENTAVLSGDDREEAKATASVTVDRGEFLTKSYREDKDTGIVTWTVKYNFNEKQIPKDQAVITDEFNSIHTWIADSLKVYKGNSTNAKDLLSADDYMAEATGTNGFKLQFNQDIDSPYTIVYQTKPVDRLSAEGQQVKNKVVSGESSKEATTPAQQSRALAKGVSNVNFADKTAKWQITVNGDKKPDGSKYSMDNVVITDTFPNNGLEFVPNSVIVKADGKTVPSSDYKVEYDQVRAGFVIKFDKTIDTTYTIEYETKFNIGWLKNKNGNFINKASMTWLENGVEKGPIERSASFSADEYTKNNGGKDGSDNPVEKEITWNIKLNYNLDPIADAIVTDVLKQNQKLVPDSVKVYEMKLTGGRNGVAKDVEVPANLYEVTEPSEANGNRLSIHFTRPISSAYWIEFKTSLQGTLIVKNIDNTAELWNGSDKTATWNASVTVPHGGEYVTKSGGQNGSKIDWSIRINEGQSHISNARIIDYPSANQVLIEDSFRLYATEIGANGDAVKAEELTKGKDYSLTISRLDGDQETFELRFAEDISTAYILEYQSFITAGDKETVQNKVALEGDQLKTELRETTEEIIVRTSSGSGSGGGVTGSLEVTKVDQDDQAKPLSGAKFALYDAAGKRAAIVKTTDADGKILFTKLLYDDYILKELEAPEGYVIDQAERNVTIDSSIVSQGHVKKLIVTNRKEEPVDPGEPSEPENPDNGSENPDDGSENPDDGSDNPDGGSDNPDDGSENPDNGSENPDNGSENPDNGSENPETPSGPSVPEIPVPTDNNPEQPPTTQPGTPTEEVEVPDEEIPKGEPTLPDTPSTDVPEPDQEPVVEIEEEELPLGGGEPETQAPTSDNPVKTLPKTGEASRYPFYLAGFGLIALGVWAGRRHMMKR